MRVLSVDVGVIHMGVVLAEVNVRALTRNHTLDQFGRHPYDTRLDEIHVLSADCVDLTQIPHQHVLRADCTLHHTKEIHDRLLHYWQENEHLWGHVDQVFIERQPFTGLTNVESLWFQRYRHKIRKLSPNGMHKWLGINRLDYDQRKIAVVEIAEYQMELDDTWARKHDVADAYVLLAYGLLEVVSKSRQTQWSPYFFKFQFLNVT